MELDIEASKVLNFICISQGCTEAEALKRAVWLMVVACKAWDAGGYMSVHNASGEEVLRIDA